MRLDEARPRSQQLNATLKARCYEPVTVCTQATESTRALGFALSSVYHSRMKKGSRSSSSRRRSDQPLGRKTFVYLTDEERRLVDEAAASERRSVSSFIAHAAVEAAERIVKRPLNKI